jgi:hypothetical protein
MLGDWSENTNQRLVEPSSTPDDTYTRSLRSQLGIGLLISNGLVRGIGHERPPAPAVG